MEKWIVTGVSGSERIELLDELKAYAEGQLGKRVVVHDVGGLIGEQCHKYGVPCTDERHLDMDGSLLKILRALAMKEVQLSVADPKSKDVDLHFIGTHATFRWKGRLMPGISYQDVIDIKPDGFVHVVRDVQKVLEANTRNPKWDKASLPNADETQHWMIEEEFVTQLLAEVTCRPMFLVARTHPVGNLAGLFFSDKKRVYLSFPITNIREDNPGLVDQIQGEYLDQLQELFVVFNPLDIKDIPLTYAPGSEEMPELVEELTPSAKELIKKRTIERDFQFIDQSHAVVALYMTKRVSAGSLAEIYYAHRNQKPVYMAFPYKRSPFIENAATYIESTVPDLIEKLRAFAEAKPCPASQGATAGR